ncbi:MAG TPA: MarR family transcriptional regulator [Stellaceae bacterium]|nr:MarR family transcriptional regulator [Stellaceae bacterium]
MSRAQSLDEILTYRISMLELLLSRAVGAVYSDNFGLNTHEWRVLAAISVWGPIEAVQVSRWATVDKAAVSRAVRGLLNKGLVERSLHERDGRKIRLELTLAGRRTVKAVVQRIGVIQERLLKDYDRQKRRDFFSMLRTIESRLRDMQEEPQRRRTARLNAARQVARA